MMFSIYVLKIRCVKIILLLRLVFLIM